MSGKRKKFLKIKRNKKNVIIRQRKGPIKKLSPMKMNIPEMNYLEKKE